MSVYDNANKVTDCISRLRDDLKKTPQIHSAAVAVDDVMYAYEATDVLHAYDLTNGAIKMVRGARSRSQWEDLTVALTRLEELFVNLAYALDREIAPL